MSDILNTVNTNNIDNPGTFSENKSEAIIKCKFQKEYICNINDKIIKESEQILKVMWT